MRREDLLNQRRTRARQADDEDRIRRRRAAAGVTGEELRRAHCLLQPRILLVRLGAVTAGIAAQRVATLVEAEGLRVLAGVLEGLAEREAQVVAVDDGGEGGGLGGAHGGDLRLLEAVGLEIGETPVGIAEAGAGRGRGPILPDGFAGASESLERVRDRQMQLRRLRGALEQAAVFADRTLVLAEPDGGECMDGAEVAIGGIGGEEPGGLLPGLFVEVALVEDPYVVGARGLIVRRQLEYSFEEQLRVIEHIALDTNARQEPHGLDVMAVPQEEGAYQLLGRSELPVGEEPSGSHHLGGELFQRCDVGGRRGGVGGLAGHPVEAFEHAPTRRQRRVDVYRLEQCADRRRRFLQHHMAQAALLVQTAEARVEPLELGEGGKRRCGGTREALRARSQVEHVTILGYGGEQCLRGGQRWRELAFLHELADAPNLEFYCRHAPMLRRPFGGGACPQN